MYRFKRKRMIELKLSTRIASLMMAIITVFTMASVSASAASWRMGNFNSKNGYSSGYTTVYLTNKKKAGKIKIHTYNCVKGNHSGKCVGSGETKAKLRVTYRTTGNKWICQFNTTSKTTLKLGKDHSAYKIDIAVRQDLGTSANWTNLGKCSHWAIETVSNTNF